MNINVLIIRTQQSAADLCKKVSKIGYRPLLLPTLSICPLQNKSALNHPTLVIFTSINAVEYGYRLIASHNHVKIAAIGQATANKLQQKNIQADIVPQNGASSEALLAHPSMQNLTGEHITIVRGIGGRERLKEQLSVHNKVVYQEVYERRFIKPNNTLKQTLMDFLHTPYGVITLSSVDSLKGLFKLLQAFKVDPKTLCRYPVAALSERIAQAAKAYGFINQIKTAKVSTNDALVDALRTIHFNSQ